MTEPSARAREVAERLLVLGNYGDEWDRNDVIEFVGSEPLVAMDFSETGEDSARRECETLRHWLARALDAFVAEERERITGLMPEVPCPECGGVGRKAYANTGTWRRGRAAGQTMTSDVCDACWGTGDAHRSGPNLRKVESAVREARAQAAAEMRERAAKLCIEVCEKHQREDWSGFPDPEKGHPPCCHAPNIAAAIRALPLEEET